MIQKLNFYSIISSKMVQEHWIQNVITLHIKYVNQTITTTTNPKYFSHTRGVGRSRCTRSYPYAYKPRKEISSNRLTE